MFGINSTVLMIGGAAIAAAVSGYVGYGLGQDNIQVKWDKQTIANQKTELAYQENLSLALETINSQDQELKQKVAVKYVDRVRVESETLYKNNDVIREVFRDTPYLSKGWVYAHDQLAKGQSIDPASASDRTPSTFTEEASLRVIGNNYGIARESKAKNDAWNDFYSGVRINYSLPAGGKEDSGNQDATVGPN